MPIQFIQCPSCHIGGYDFCPDCLGAGGYSIEVTEIIEVPVFIEEDRIIRIIRQLKLIEEKDIWNNQIEVRLKEWFLELTGHYYTEEVVDCLKRILKFQRYQKKKELVHKLTERLHDLPKLEVMIIGESVSKFTSQIKDIKFRNNVLVNIKDKVFVELDTDLFRTYLYNLMKNSKLKLSEILESGNFSAIDKLLIEGNDDISFVIFKDFGDVNSFVININLYRDVMKEFIIQLQRNDTKGWRYINEDKVERKVNTDFMGFATFDDWWYSVGHLWNKS
jgi:hypothetical protein